MGGKDRIRRSCERIVRELDLPVSLDMETVCARVGARVGRQILLRPMSMPDDGPNGVWVDLGHLGVIFYQSTGTSKVHQLHIVLHELGHLLSGHEGALVMGGEAARTLLPDIDQDRFRQVLGRTRYSEDDERMAETIASLIPCRAGSWNPQRPWLAPPEQASFIAQLDRSLSEWGPYGSR
jgi:hypothetical protein